MNFSRRDILKALGSSAGMTATLPLASSAEPGVVRTINIDTSAYDRVDEARVTYLSNGGIKHYTAGQQSSDTSPIALTIKLNNGETPEHAEAEFVTSEPRKKPNLSRNDLDGQMTEKDIVGTMDHREGGSNDSDGSAYLKLICQKGDRCGCWPEWDVYNRQEAEWNDDDGDGCVSDAEHSWSWSWDINNDSCYSWEHKEGKFWEDDETCSLDQVREDRFLYNDGSNKVVMRQQLTAHADGSSDWEVTRYDSGGNGCLFHRVETG